MFYRFLMDAFPAWFNFTETVNYSYLPLYSKVFYQFWMDFIIGFTWNFG